MYAILLSNHDENVFRSQHLLQKLTNRLTTVTIMDGITMGSAVLFGREIKKDLKAQSCSLGFNSKFSVATERTLWAVPEVTHWLLDRPTHPICDLISTAGAIVVVPV